MLERVHIENYKCLRDVTVDLGDFTILIGPNDSGKSSFLDSIRVLASTALGNKGSAFANDHAFGNLVWMKDLTRRICWEIAGKAAGKSFVYHLELQKQNQFLNESLIQDGRKVFWTEHAENSQQQTVRVSSDSTISVLATGKTVLSSWNRTASREALPVAETISSSTEYRFDPSRMTSPSQPRSGESLSPTGENLAGFLDLLLSGPRRADFVRLEADLHKAIPTLKGIYTPPAQGNTGAKALHYILSGNESEPVTIPASLASAGALILTAFLSLAYSTTKSLLFFEEPENGLHPSRLAFVIDILRKMSTGEIGNRKRQIIVTTHNPLLLNYAKPDEVRVFIRDPEQGTIVRPMAEVTDIDKLLKEFSLGELWYLLGEEKLVKGKIA